MIPSSFLFQLDDTYPANFPKSLDFDEVDPLTAVTHQEAYESSQQAGVPYYAVYIVETTQKSNKEDKAFFHVYDMSGYLANSKKQVEGSLCTITRQTIKKIQMFVVRCFESDPKHLFSPIDPAKKQLTFQPIPPHVNKVIDQLLQDALNNLENPSYDGKMRLRRAQYLLAALVKTGNPFPQIAQPGNEEENRLWLWCSARGSHHGVVQLFQACVEAKIASAAANYQKLLLDTSQIAEPESLTTRIEREACLTAQVLVKKHAILVMH